MVNSTIHDRIQGVNGKYRNFNKEKSSIYLDKDGKISSLSVLKKINKDSYVEDLPTLLRMCYEMKNILADCVTYIESTNNTITNKDMEITNLQSKEVSKSDLTQLKDDIKIEIVQEVKSLIEHCLEKKTPDISQGSNIKNEEHSEIEKMKPILLIENQTLEEDSSIPMSKDQWATVVKRNVTNKLKDIPVNKSSLTSKGRATLTFSSVDARDKAAEILSDDYKVTCHDKSLKKLPPKLKLLGAATDVYDQDDEDIITAIRQKNKEINILINEGDDFKIVHKNKRQELIVIKTTAKIRDVIKRMGNKIHLGLEIIPVYDQIHIIQCFHCQEHGHYAGSIYCKYKDNEFGFCFYCASRHHKSSQCDVKNDRSKHKCSNCTKNKCANRNHKATDPLCPSVIRETQMTIARTSGLEDSKNWYTKKIQRLRAVRRLA